MFLAFQLSDIITVPFGWLLSVLYETTHNYGVAMILVRRHRAADPAAPEREVQEEHDEDVPSDAQDAGHPAEIRG